MDQPRQLDRFQTANRRLHNVLRTHVVANDRILEQKISDAGPGSQRIDPHILTLVRNALVKAGHVSKLIISDVPWYHLPSANPALVTARLNTLRALHDRTQRQALSVSIGQTLEIAVFRALAAERNLQFFGAFRDLTDHDDSTLYAKDEPPSIMSGRSIRPKNIDFLVHGPAAIYGGIEVKNIRQWIYPARQEVRDLLWKCCTLDVVPVLIARRIHYSTFSVLNPCGVIIHQTYNQLYPMSAQALAQQVRDKTLLGYHDVRVGNEPDARLTRFIGTNLPRLLPTAREKFDQFKDLLLAYATEEHSYKSFAARVKRRMRGEPEDLPPFEPESGDDSEGGFEGFE